MQTESVAYPAAVPPSRALGQGRDQDDPEPRVATSAKETRAVWGDTATAAIAAAAETESTRIEMSATGIHAPGLARIVGVMERGATGGAAGLSGLLNDRSIERKQRGVKVVRQGLSVAH
jgi:hypothetical protein